MKKRPAVASAPPLPLAVKDLRPAPYNPRKITEAELARLKKALAAFGDLGGIVVNVRSGYLVGGHQRVRQLDAAWPIRKAPARDATGTVARGWVETPWGRLDYREVDWPPAKERAANVAANQHGGDFDLPALKELLVGLDDGAFDLELTGFDEADLKKLIDWDGHGGGAADAVPGAPRKPVTRAGDLYALGAHRLLCGDATHAADVDRLMGGKVADVVFTDPPYALFGNSTGVSGVADDKMVRPFFRDLFLQAQRVTKPYGHVYVCCDWHSAFVIQAMAREVDLTPKNLCVWDKGSGGIGTMYQHGYELVWFFANTPIQKTTTKQRHGERVVCGISNLWRFPRVVGEERQHNAAKPVDLICVPLGASSDSGQVVLDLFGGSGSTLVAAEKLKRECYTMEVEPAYCDVIVARWETFTGKKAARLP